MVSGQLFIFSGEFKNPRFSHSGRQDSNLRPLGPEPSALAKLSYAPWPVIHSIRKLLKHPARGWYTKTRVLYFSAWYIDMATVRKAGCVPEMICRGARPRTVVGENGETIHQAS